MQNTKVFVGGIRSSVQQRDVEDFFAKFGPVREVTMKTGFAFVEFNDARDAEQAVREGNESELLPGQRVHVQLADGRRRDGEGRAGPDGRFGGARGFGDRFDPYQRPQMRRHTDFRVVVRGLNPGTSWQDLKDFLRMAGEVIYTDIRRSRDGGTNEGVGEFERSDDVERALRELNGTDCKGSRVEIVEDRDGAYASSAQAAAPPRRDFDDRRGGYDDRRGGYDDRRGGYDDRRGGYDDRRGGYDDRRGGGSSNGSSGGYDDRRGGYDDRRGGSSSNGGGFDDRRGGYDDRRGGYDDRRGGASGGDRRNSGDDRRGGGYDDRRFDNDDRRGGYGDDRRGGYGDDRRDGYAFDRRSAAGGDDYDRRSPRRDRY